MKRSNVNKFFSGIGRFVVDIPEDGNRSPDLFRYGVALLCVMVAFGIRYSLNPILGPHAVFILFLPAIIIAAWRGGIGPALVAIFASLVLANYYFVLPQNQWNPISANQIVAALIEVFSAIFVVGLMNALRREQERKLAKARLLEREVEQREQAEIQLRERDQRLRAILENSPAIIFLKDCNGRYLLSNPKFETISQKTGGQIFGKTDHEIFPRWLADSFHANDLKVLEKGVPLEYEQVTIQDDGPHTSIVQKFPLHDSSGKIYAIGGIVTDITQRKQTEEALRNSETRLRVLSETALDAIISVDTQGNIIQFNRGGERIFGYSAEEIMGKSFFLLMPGRVHEAQNWEFQQFFISGQGSLIGKTTELAGIRKDGSEFPLELSLSAWQTDEGDYFTAIIRDITHRKRAAEALRHSEELLRTTTEGARIGLWSWDIANDSFQGNPIEYQFFGLPTDAKINLSLFLDCMHPEDREGLKTAIETCLRLGSEINVEHRMVQPDGKVRWIQCKGRVSYIDGRAVRLSGMSLDITERREAEEALRRQAELLDLAQVLVLDLNNKILFWNQGAEDLYGWSKEEAVGKNCHELLRTEFPEPLDQIKRKLLEANHWEGELAHSRKDGQNICVASHWALYRDAQKRAIGILESNNNITDLKKAETSLQEAQVALANHAEQLEEEVNQRTTQLQRSIQDMESFCYTIAHDLRSPLRAISGFSQILIHDYAPQWAQTGYEYCERIYVAANRMNQLISDLLVYGRLTQGELPVQPVDLAATVELVLTRAALQIEERHTEVEVDKPLPEVCGDPPILEQVLENLITNAVKFVPSDRQPHLHIYAEQHGDIIRLCVEDNGIGILPEHRQRIFRPFERLHTAQAYPGTGIGLAIVQRGIEKMNGHVGVEAAPVQGSRFWIELPDKCGPRS